MPHPRQGNWKKRKTLVDPTRFFPSLLERAIKQPFRGVTKYEYHQLNPAWLETQMSQVMKSSDMGNALGIAMGCYNEIQRWVSSYAVKGDKGVSDFFWHWKLARNFVGLQVRLVAEQVLFDLGPPWSELVTGFKAVGSTPKGTRGGARTASVAGPRSALSPNEGTEAGTASGGVTDPGEAVAQLRMGRFR